MASNQPRVPTKQPGTYSPVPKHLVPFTTSDDHAARMNYYQSHIQGNNSPFLTTPQSTSASYSEKRMPDSHLRDPRLVPPPNFDGGPATMYIDGVTRGDSTGSGPTGSGQTGSGSETNGGGGDGASGSTSSATHKITSTVTPEDIRRAYGNNNEGMVSSSFSTPQFSMYDIVIMIFGLMMMVGGLSLFFMMYQITRSVNQTNLLLQTLLVGNVHNMHQAATITPSVLAAV